MSESFWAAFFTALPPTLTALAALIVGLRNSAKADVIVGHVNSEKTASEGRELTLRSENELLKQMVTDKTATAALLAQAVATRAPASSSAEASLQKIDQNTEAIADNTAKTSEEVKGMKDALK